MRHTQLTNERTISLIGAAYFVSGSYPEVREGGGAQYGGKTTGLGTSLLDGHDPMDGGASGDEYVILEGGGASLAVSQTTNE